MAEEQRQARTAVGRAEYVDVFQMILWKGELPNVIVECGLAGKHSGGHGRRYDKHGSRLREFTVNELVYRRVTLLVIERI
ncbi:hypothetical protein [Streptomyces erythrochromogenes]|uniref:hypothetical protein n=1 Tax=Streptomyces erythrochromogenes TaxID=285574 RepID=UPI0037F738E0|nr:hypothetical protein OG489_25240 [Streptomyces erythrochromogenes]